MSPQPRGCFEASSRLHRPLKQHRFTAQGDCNSARNLKAKSLTRPYLLAMIKAFIILFLSSFTNNFTTATIHSYQTHPFLRSGMASSSKTPAPKSPKNLNIPEDENETVVIPNLSEGEEAEITNRMLAGKIITAKNLNGKGIRGAFKQMWENYQEVSFLEGGNNTCAFTFQSQEEAQIIWNKSWNKSPWFVLNHLMCLQEWGEAESSTQVTKEEWYDADGKLICVMVTTMFGSQTYVVDELGDLTPPTP